MPKDKKNSKILDKKEELEDYAAGIKEIKNAREIVQLLAKTTSQMKIFASDHVNISRFTDELFGKMNEFLKKHWKFELGVQEFSFTYKGKTVYTDKQIKKSIPFLFYKDGVQSLYFYKDLTKDEFLDFLDVIKKEANLPAEESDIVISLWEKTPHLSNLETREQIDRHLSRKSQGFRRNARTRMRWVLALDLALSWKI